MRGQPKHDRGSAIGLLESGYVQGFIGGLVGLIFTPLLQARGQLPGGLHITVLGIVASFFVVKGIAGLVARTSGVAATAIYSPSGDTTAYIPTFSHIDALTIRGDLDGAAAAWAAVLAEQPQSVAVAVKAADFHLRDRGEPAAALELFLRARALADSAMAGTNLGDLRRYTQQKIVDLYLGPLADEGRALAELRRLIDAFPGTREAAAARESLAELKARRAGVRSDQA